MLLFLTHPRREPRQVASPTHRPPVDLTVQMVRALHRLASTSTIGVPDRFRTNTWRATDSMTIRLDTRMAQAAHTHAAHHPDAPTPKVALKRTLGMPSLVLLGLVYMVPLTIFTTYGLVVELTGGRLPLAYIITLAAMLFTARSYGKMAQAYPVAGSAYTYGTRAFGGPIGFLTGWTLMLDYMLLPMINGSVAKIGGSQR